MDWDRRDFLAGVGATTGLAAGAAVAGAASAMPAPPVRMIVADERYAAACAFAAAHPAGNIAWIAGDISDLWYRTLDPLWRRAPVSVEGMTDYRAYFCLERLAWDRGLRTARKTEHRAGEAPRLIAWTFALKRRNGDLA